MSKPRNFNAPAWAQVAIADCFQKKMAREDLPECLYMLFHFYDDTDYKTLADFNRLATFLGSDFEKCFRRNIRFFGAIAEEIDEKEQRKRRNDLRRLAE